MKEQIKTTVKDDGFEGILFPGNHSKDKVLIVVSGSNGGMKMTVEIAQFYNSNGIPALAVAMFNTKQTINGLVRVPLEYAECAIKWLKEQGYQRIGIDGTKVANTLYYAHRISMIFPALLPEFRPILSAKDLRIREYLRIRLEHHAGVIKAKSFHLPLTRQRISILLNCF